MKARPLHLPSQRLLTRGSSYNTGKLKITSFVMEEVPSGSISPSLLYPQIIDTKISLTFVCSCPRLWVEGIVWPTWTLLFLDNGVEEIHTVPRHEEPLKSCLVSASIGLYTVKLTQRDPNLYGRKAPMLRQPMVWGLLEALTVTTSLSESSFIIEPDSGGVRTSEF